MIVDRLRTPVFIAIAIVWLVVVGIEIGSALLPAKVDTALAKAQSSSVLQSAGVNTTAGSRIANQVITQAANSNKPPGLSIPDLALLDGLILYIVLLIGAGWIAAQTGLQGIQGRVQGIVTLIVSILVLLADVALFFRAFVQLMIMLGLFFSVPFGTLAYLAIWGFFNRGGAAAILSASMLFKLVSILLLFIAQQRFLRITSLMLIIATSLLGNFIISLLHGIVPIILVSITDAIGAVIVTILIAIWAIFFLIGAIISIVKAVV
jgi:hypothetical protein